MECYFAQIFREDIDGLDIDTNFALYRGKTMELSASDLIASFKCVLCLYTYKSAITSNALLSVT